MNDGPISQAAESSLLTQLKELLDKAEKGLPVESDLDDIKESIQNAIQETEKNYPDEYEKDKVLPVVVKYLRMLILEIIQNKEKKSRGKSGVKKRYI